MILRDCAFRLQVAYLLPRDLHPGDIEDLFVEEPTIQRFSEQIPGAKDHVRGAISPYSWVAGAVGGRRLVVTFGKLGSERGPEDRGWVEGVLVEAFGPIATSPRAAGELGSVA